MTIINGNNDTKNVINKGGIKLNSIEGDEKKNTYITKKQEIEIMRRVKKEDRNDFSSLEKR